MTQEEIIELLKRMKNNTTVRNSGEQEEVDHEIEEIDATIEDYNEKIKELEEKIANLDNYQYEEANKEERELTTELLEESFASQLEVLEREDQEYKTLQELATSVFTDYNLEIATLNNDIAMIERRLRKNDIAVRKNIGIKLTDEELNTLNVDLELKRARIAECENMKSAYVEDLRNYGELITANNRKREIVTQKQERLNAIKQDRLNNPKTIDNVKLRNDKDELASLKAGVAALEARKNSISYNMNEDIDKLLNHYQQNNEIKIEAANTNDVLENANEEIIPEEDKSQALIDAYNVGNEDLLEEPEKNTDRIFTDEERITYGKNKGILGIPEVTTGHDLWLAEHSDLDNLREAEIEEAPEILKRHKVADFFKKHWKKFVAGAIAVAIILAAKGCSDTKDSGKYLDNSNDITSSHHQTEESPYDDEQDEKEDDHEQTPEDDEQPDLDPTPEDDLEPDPEPTPEDDLEPDPEPTPEDDLEPEPEPTPNEPINGELAPEESAITADDLIDGNIDDDHIISHGDEDGKETDTGLGLTGYDEDGNAAIEYTPEGNDETAGIPEIDRDQIIENLEDFMGGELELTDEENQWIDEIVSERRLGR